MTQIFTSKKSTLFVGGRGTKAGEADCGGGCTYVTWLNDEDISLFMDSNGGAISDVSTWGGFQTSCTTQNDGGKLRINKVGGFVNVIIGTLAYINMSFDPNYIGYDELRYEVLTRDDDYIIINLVYQGSSPTCDIKVGGAFVDLNTALGVMGTSLYSVEIYTNKNETLTAQIAPTGEGDIINDSYIWIEGFKTYPGDCNFGGSCYQDPLDAYVNGLDSNCKVYIDADDGAWSILKIDSKNKIIFNNIRFFNNSGSNEGVEFLNSPFGVGFINCIFDDVYNYSSGVVGGVRFKDCLFQDARNTSPTNVGSTSGKYDRCVFNGTGLNWAYQINYEFYWDCLFVNGAYGATLTYYSNIINCIFYNQTIACIYINSVSALLMGFNNIFVPAAVNDYVVEIGAIGGSISQDFDKSCCYSIGNGPLTNMVNNIKLSLTYDLPGSVIEQDPLLRSAVNSDFRLKAESLCLNSGARTQGGLV